jgi:hypothetical protein
MEIGKNFMFIVQNKIHSETRSVRLSKDFSNKRGFDDLIPEILIKIIKSKHGLNGNEID